MDGHMKLNVFFEMFMKYAKHSIEITQTCRERSKEMQREKEGGGRERERARVILIMAHWISTSFSTTRVASVIFAEAAIKGTHQAPISGEEGSWSTQKADVSRRDRSLSIPL